MAYERELMERFLEVHTEEKTVSLRNSAVLVRCLHVEENKEMHIYFAAQFNSKCFKDLIIPDTEPDKRENEKES